MNGNLDKKNGFLYAKAAVAALCGAFTAAFGWLGWLVLAWAACMALDWLSGSAAAASRGEWSSAAARAGIWHKAGMVVVVCVAALTDLVLNVAVENLPAFGDGVGVVYFYRIRLHCREWRGHGGTGAGVAAFVVGRKQGESR